jgi:glycosyltransferase involved in cell wall biosynthesis
LKGGPIPEGPIRILHLADVVNRRDFIDNVVRNLDPGLFHVEVCTLGDQSNIEDPRYDLTDISHWTVARKTRWHLPWVALRVGFLLRQRRIDVVHAHHFEPCLIAALAVTMSPRARLVVGRHYSDAIYLHTSGWRQRVMLALEHWVNARACRIVAPSGVILDLLRDQGVPPGRVALIPYGFDRSKFSDISSDRVLRQRSDLHLDGHVSIATFARLYVDKGHKFVLDALPAALLHIPNLRYLIVGDGPDRAKLEEQVVRCGLTDHVSFLGWRRDVPELMSAVDIVVQPSLQEAFSQSMVETLLLGRPLIATDVSGAREIVPDPSAGIVVPKGDHTALAAAIVELATNPARRAALGAAGQKHACANLTVTSMVSQMEAVYGACAGRGSG